MMFGIQKVNQIGDVFMNNLNDFILNAPIKVKRHQTKYDE